MSNGDLISRNSLMQVLEGKLYENQLQMPCDWFNFIRRMPAVDAEPVAHGRWQCVFTTNAGGKAGWCSNCGFLKDVDNYCPNCGARMDQEVDHGKVD